MGVVFLFLKGLVLNPKFWVVCAVLVGIFSYHRYYGKYRESVGKIKGIQEVGDFYKKEIETRQKAQLEEIEKKEKELDKQLLELNKATASLYESRTSDKKTLEQILTESKAGRRVANEAVKNIDPSFLDDTLRSQSNKLVKTPD